MRRYYLKMESVDGLFSVIDRVRGCAVLSGETLAVASRVEERLNGVTSGYHGEPEEVADAIRERAATFAPNQ